MNNDSMFDEEFKSKAKDTVDKADETIKKNKRTFLEIVGFTALVLFFKRLMTKQKKSTDQASFELGKMAGRAEYAEELAEKAILSGMHKN